jgi:hypothetical protein
VKLSAGAAAGIEFEVIERGRGGADLHSDTRDVQKVLVNAVNTQLASG